MEHRRCTFNKRLGPCKVVPGFTMMQCKCGRKQAVSPEKLKQLQQAARKRRAQGRRLGRRAS